MTFKQKVYHLVLELLNEKIAALQNILNDLRESAANETKSTAGDKHETALAMLQIEQENTNRQLKELLAQKSILQKIDPSIKTSSITNGSLVETNKGWFFVSIPLGKISVGELQVIALSQQSPLGSKIKGLQQNETTEINGLAYVILSVD